MQLLIVDGYNIIYSWEELCFVAQTDLALAREKLWNALTNYCSFEGIELLLVFDAHLSRKHDAQINLKNKRKGNQFNQVFTKRQQTADNFIERFCWDCENKNKQIVVATSDRLIQVLVFSKATRISARELEIEVGHSLKKIRKKMHNKHKKQGNNIEDIIESSTYTKLDAFRKK